MSSSNCCFVTCIQISQEADKALPKARLAPKKVMGTVWWSDASLIHYSFLNPGETITSEKYAQQIDVKHWTLQRRQPVYGSTQWAQFFTTPDHTLPNTSEVERIGLQSFASSAMFTWPLANWLPLLWASWELFAGEMLPQPALLKLNELGYEVLPYLPYSPHLSPTDYHFFKHLDDFLQGKHPQPAGCRKCFLRVLWMLKHGFIY